MTTTDPPAIQLPRDHYAHVEAPTEWWWHVGTLKTVDQDRTFGFEVNATSVTGLASFSRIMITDIGKQKHYQNSTVYDFDPKWAESDPSKPWYVKLGSPGHNGVVSMTAPSKDITSMNVSASFTDVETPTHIIIN